MNETNVFSNKKAQVSGLHIKPITEQEFETKRMSIKEMIAQLNKNDVEVEHSDTPETAEVQENIDVPVSVETPVYEDNHSYEAPVKEDVPVQEAPVNTEPTDIDDAVSDIESDVQEDVADTKDTVPVITMPEIEPENDKQEDVSEEVETPVDEVSENEPLLNDTSDTEHTEPENKTNAPVSEPTKQDKPKISLTGAFSLLKGKLQGLHKEKKETVEDTEAPKKAEATQSAATKPATDKSPVKEEPPAENKKDKKPDKPQPSKKKAKEKEELNDIQIHYSDESVFDEVDEETDEEQVQPSEEEQKKEKVPLNTPDAITKKQQNIQASVSQYHKTTEESEVQRYISKLDDLCSSRNKRVTVYATCIIDSNFKSLSIIKNQITEFIELALDMDTNIDFSYAFIITDKGVQQFGNDDVMSDITLAMEDLRMLFINHRGNPSPDKIKRIKSLNIFETLYIEQ